jgi:hypothetical protein
MRSNFSLTRTFLPAATLGILVIPIAHTHNGTFLAQEPKECPD